MKNKLYLNDLILNILIILLCISVPTCLSLLADDGEKTAVVSVDGKTSKEISLSKNEKIEIEGMIIEVKDGKAHVLESDCPDGLCMKMKKAQNVGDSIICVPNKVSVRIVGSEQKGADVIAG